MRVILICNQTQTLDRPMIKQTTLSLFLCFLSSAALAADAELVIKDHQFSPKELVVPAGQKVKLTVINNDSTAAEFESFELNREKIINGNSKATVFIGPLEPGRYPIFEEFHKDTTQGVIIAQ